MMKIDILYTAVSSGLLRKTLRSLIMVMFLSSAAGCATVGHEFPAGQVSTIKIGETTQNDIRATFGNPWRTGIENGLRTWTYGIYQYSLFDDASTEDLLIRFDKRGIVSSFVFNTTKRSK
jgi:outer membrane protein assembly factor BamE (lipoprotein component of BamABCDE complex)